MQKLASLMVAIGLVTTACGGSDDGLSSAESDWCANNYEIVLDAADDLGLVDFVISYYDSAGDGLDSDGVPIETDRNIEISEELRARNSQDPDALGDFLYAEYLNQDAGKTACATAYAEEG